MTSRLDRALRILMLLQSGQRYDPCALAKKLKVDRRTMFRDIALLREMGICVNYAPDRGQYVIGDLDSDQQGVHESEFRDVLNRVISDEGQDDSVKSIIRQVAFALAGHVDERDLEIRQHNQDCSAGKPPEESRTNESESSLDAKLMRVDTDHPNYPKRTGPINVPTAWCFTRENLSMLTRAVDEGSIIEIFETDPEEGRLRESAVRVRPIEFTVKRDEVIVMGVDPNGGEISSASHSFRCVQQGIRDQTISGQSQPRCS